MNELITLFYRTPSIDGSQPAFPRSAVPFMKPSQFADMIMASAKEYSVTNKKPAKLAIPQGSFCRPCNSWLPAFLGLLDPHGNKTTPEVWYLAIVRSLRDLKLEIIPGPYNNRVCAVRFTRLQDYTDASNRYKPPIVANTQGAAALVIQAKISITKMPVKIPFIMLPPLYVQGYQEIIDATRKKHTEPEGLKSFQLENFYEAVHSLVDLEDPSHMIFLVVGWALSSLPRPPVGMPWTGDPNQDFVIHAGARATAGRAGWYFLFVARCMMQCEKSLANHPLPQIIKILGNPPWHSLSVVISNKNTRASKN